MEAAAAAVRSQRPRRVKTNLRSVLLVAAVGCRDVIDGARSDDPMIVSFGTTLFRSINPISQLGSRRWNPWLQRRVGRGRCVPIPRRPGAGRQRRVWRCGWIRGKHASWRWRLRRWRRVELDRRRRRVHRSLASSERSDRLWWITDRLMR